MPTVRLPIRLTWTEATGSPGANVWHARVNGELDPNPDVETISEILFDFYTAIINTYPNLCQIHWDGEAQGVGDDQGDTYTSPGWTLTGTGSSAFAPPGLAMYVNWRSSSGGRNGRGRTFLGPHNSVISEANGTPTESYRGIVQTAADDLVEASDSFGNGALGVYSRVENTFRDYVSAVVPNKFGMLRTRRD